jgi:hypothetical protein
LELGCWSRNDSPSNSRANGFYVKKTTGDSARNLLKGLGTATGPGGVAGVWVGRAGGGGCSDDGKEGVQVKKTAAPRRDPSRTSARPVFAMFISALFAIC